ncbi:uncharacterized protein LOC115414022 [Sphaeramia orbicularis]|uniref:uncharacterized protein LOC115414022 n=1 Tax=Sphaeramia orbicularis TaxID=375764 RepID=UPI00117E6777|nr:uncharacterized protein LOC115414022 [Sphaeramia orbicularis]
MPPVKVFVDFTALKPPCGSRRLEHEHFIYHESSVTVDHPDQQLHRFNQSEQNLQKKWYLCWTPCCIREKINTNCYKLKIKDGSFITLKSCWFSFMNPWTKEVENTVSTSSVVMMDMMVISEGQRMFEEDTQAVIVGVKNISQKKKTDEPAQGYSTTKVAATSGS